MTTTEIKENLTFVAALQMLERLATKNLLTDTEARRTHQELERRLRPTLILL